MPAGQKIPPSIRTGLYIIFLYLFAVPASNIRSGIKKRVLTFRLARLFNILVAMSIDCFSEKKKDVHLNENFRIRFCSGRLPLTPSPSLNTAQGFLKVLYIYFIFSFFQAYKLKTRPTAVQIARIAAFTVITCTFILGSFMLAAAWLQANASCSQLMHAEALLRQVTHTRRTHR